MALTHAIQCPECKKDLPTIRKDTPWCECGWSSINDWLSIKTDPRFRKKLEKDRRHSEKLAAIDLQLLQKEPTRFNQVIWRFFLVLSLLLCLPIYFIKVTFLTALIYSLVIIFINQIRSLIFIFSLILLGIFLYRFLTRMDRKFSEGILIQPQNAPELFRLLNSVAERSSSPPIKKVRISLDGSIGVKQKAVIRPKPHFESEVLIGLFSLNVLSISQFKAVIAHEAGHLSGIDGFYVKIIYQSITSLSSWTDFLYSISEGLRVFGLITILISQILKLYLIILIPISLRAMRRQEYLADRYAASIYGKSTLLQALINLMAIQICFQEYLPFIFQNIENDIDRHDIYYQFKKYWDLKPERLRQEYYAKGVKALRSIYDSHPSYSDRRKALSSFPESTIAENEDELAINLIHQADELGRELTVRRYQDRFK